MTVKITQWLSLYVGMLVCILMYAVITLYSRSKDIVEPLIKPQWWLDCTGMAKEAVNVSLTVFNLTSSLSLSHTHT